VELLDKPTSPYIMWANACSIATKGAHDDKISPHLRKRRSFFGTHPLLRPPRSLEYLRTARCSSYDWPGRQFTFIRRIGCFHHAGGCGGICEKRPLRHSRRCVPLVSCRMEGSPHVIGRLRRSDGLVRSAIIGKERNHEISAHFRWHQKHHYP